LIPDTFKSLININVCINQENKFHGYWSFFHNLQGYLTIGGNVSEFLTNFYESNNEIDERRLAQLSGYEGNAYVIQTLNEWLNIGKKVCDKTGYRLLDLYYLEQRFGNWGAGNVADSDIAVERFFPFNCRYLLETLVSVPSKFRTGKKNQLYLKIIQSLWPACLKIPINKPSLKDRFILFLVKLGIYSEIKTTLKLFTLR
jgi:hypothetical protein